MTDPHFTPEQLLEKLRQERKTFTDALMAENTCIGYRYDFNMFERWCIHLGLTPLPCTGETLSLYITGMLTRGLKCSTVRRHVAAIVYVCRKNNTASPLTPEVCELLAGARRLRAERIDQARPLTLDHLGIICDRLKEEDTPLAARNRAILLVGFASALRTASLASLTLEDLRISQPGIELWIRREKQDWNGKTRSVAIPRAETQGICPVLALELWLTRRGSFPGPLFTRFDHKRPTERALQPERIGQIVHQCAARVGLEDYTGHSMRAGFCTEAFEHSIGAELIAHHTGHRDLATLRTYFRRSQLWKANVAGALGL